MRKLWMILLAATLLFGGSFLTVSGQTDDPKPTPTPAKVKAPSFKILDVYIEPRQINISQQAPLSVTLIVSTSLGAAEKVTLPLTLGSDIKLSLSEATTAAMMAGATLSAGARPPINQPAQESSLASDLLRLLHFIPNEALYRQYLTYGDAAAWHSSWSVPRIDNFNDLEGLDREANAYWKFIMPRQTLPPNSLGRQYLRTDNQRSFYGFDLFNLDRFVEAGLPPDWITLVEFSFDGAQIAEALTTSGYEATSLADKAMLYSILDDYEVAVDFPTASGKLGNLNRIALIDGQMIIAKATANVTAALDAYRGQVTALADDPAYIAAALALDDPALSETGELIGVILMDGSQFVPTWYVGRSAGAESIEDLKKRLPGPPLPAYSLVAFATRHTKGASYLILAVVFPTGVDAAAAAAILAGRLQTYTSLATNSTLDDHWSFQKATGAEANGLPVALVVMRVDDPPLAPKDAALTNSAVFAWYLLVARRDVLFLLAE